MLWLDLHCPELPLEVFAGVPASPAAVVEPQGAREVLVACNDAARRGGAVPGMALGAARVRVPGLEALARDPAAERAALERLAAACLRFTDHVALEPPADVLLEIGGSRRLFGGLEPLLERVDALAATLGRGARRGVAPVPAAARLLARAGGGRIDAGREPEEALADLPVALLDLDPEAAERLEGWGIRRLGDCFALPRTGLARRLGRAFVDRLDRLRGRRAETPPRFTPPARFDGTLALPAEAATLELPLLAVERLLAELEAWLRARDAGVQDFEVALHPRRGAPARVAVGLAAPGRDAGHMLVLARERLERAGVPGSVVAVGVRARSPVRYHPPVADLWTDAGAEPPERLLERLRARLGRAAVHGLGLHADHRPERAWGRQAPGQTPAHEPLEPAPRPLWLLAEPGALALDDRRRPLCQGPLELVDGPERIETGWWDGDDVERDYYVARNPAGSLLWIYRERRVPAPWYLHGLFA